MKGVIRLIPEKIVNALEYCAGQGITSECEGCKYKKGCRPDLIVDALALIKRQKAKIAELQHKIVSCNAEIEKLKRRNDELNSLNKTAAIDAMEDLATRLKDDIREIRFAAEAESQCEHIDDVLNEYLGR